VGKSASDFVWPEGLISLRELRYSKDRFTDPLLKGRALIIATQYGLVKDEEDFESKFSSVEFRNQITSIIPRADHVVLGIDNAFSAWQPRLRDLDRAATKARTSRPSTEYIRAFWHELECSPVKFRLDDWLLRAIADKATVAVGDKAVPPPTRQAPGNGRRPQPEVITADVVRNVLKGRTVRK
jgi:hypothetical protein